MAFSFEHKNQRTHYLGVNQSMNKIHHYYSRFGEVEFVGDPFRFFEFELGVPDELGVAERLDSAK